MALLQLETAASPNRFPLMQLGFRPFFLGAMGFAIVGILLWTALYSFHWQVLTNNYPAMTWHAHEMLFGYIMAVVAGFLLTAVRNWTGQQTLQGWPLMGLVGLWLLARFLPFTTTPLLLIAVVDLSFMLVLLIAVARPIIQAKQWQQLGIISKLLLLGLANTVFYLGLLGLWKTGISIGIYASFYLIVALILTMGRRVIPFFIERGLGVPFQARNSVAVDRSSLVLFLLFTLAELAWIATGNQLAFWLSIGLAALQVPLHVWRLWAWYHPAIWTKPLLWVLYVAYAWLVSGFVLTALTPFLHLSPWIALHAFAYGGMGMVTAGMMARVSLGHTGRNVSEPPTLLNLAFILLLIGSCIRVIADGLLPQWHAHWILIAQVLWIASFSVLFRIYWPILIR